MKLSNISSSPLFYVTGVVVVGGLTLGTVVPTDTDLHHYLADNALLVMVFFLITGFLGLAVRQNTVILFNFLACIVVCSFLKDKAPAFPTTEARETPLQVPLSDGMPKAAYTAHTDKAPASKHSLVWREARNPDATPVVWISNNP